MAPMIPVTQMMTVTMPAMMISAAPEAMLLPVTNEKSESIAMPQLPMPIRIQPRIYRGREREKGGRAMILMCTMLYFSLQSLVYFTSRK